MSLNRTFPIAGVKFRPSSVYELLKTLEDGSVFELEAEPTNKFDPNAVKIMYFDGSDDIHVGYVPKNFSAEVSAALEIEPYCAVAKNFSAENKSWEFEVELRPLMDEEDDTYEGEDDVDDPSELKEQEDFAKDNELEREDED
jgi:hypothetical protein